LVVFTQTVVVDGARETREGRAGGAESEEAGEAEALCGAVSRKTKLAFTPAKPYNRRNMPPSDARYTGALLLLTAVR
jgi:hypothetical protein